MYLTVNNTADTVNERLTVTAHGITPAVSLETVTCGTIDNTGGSIFGGVTASFNYYLYVVDANTISLHTTRQGGLDGVSNKVNITSNGTGTNRLWLLLTNVKCSGSKISADYLPTVFRQLCLGSEVQVIGQKDAIEGVLSINAWGRVRLRWTVLTGTRTLTVSVKQAVNVSPRPTMVIKANSAIGIAADVTGTAGAGTGYVTIGPLSVTPSSDGAVWVELWNNLRYQFGSAPALFKDLINA